MRTLSGQQQRVLGLQSRRTCVDVQVYNTTTSSWVSLAALYGYNFIRQITWQNDISSNGATATVTIDRNIYYYNTAPTVVGSKVYANYGTLIDINVKIKLFVAVMPQGTNPQASDWIEVFYGRIYQTDWSGNDFTLSCQDWIGQLQSLYIEQSYGIIAANPTGVTSQSILQACLTYASGLSGVSLALPTLYSVNGTSGTPFIAGSAPDDPGWNVISTTPYPTSLQTIYTAMSNLVQQIGWCLYQRWNPNINTWALTFFDPLRTSTTSVWTFPASQYINIGTCGQMLGNIRNVVQVVYNILGTAGSNAVPAFYTLPDPGTNSPSGWPSGTLGSQVSANNATSLAKYGRQFMQIGSDSTTGITGFQYTSGAYNGLYDYQVLALNSLNDLQLPKFQFSVDVPLFPAIELNDIYTFKADGDHFDSDQTLTVMSYEHEVQQNSIGKTTINTQGFPSVGAERWLAKQAISVTKQFGILNQIVNFEYSGNLTPNGSLSVFSRG